MDKIKVKFPKGVHRIHVPFLAKPRVNGESPYDELHDAIARIGIPKGAKFIRATFEMVVDLRKVPAGLNLSRTGAEVVFEK